MQGVNTCCLELMYHTFTIVQNANGNITIKFFDDSKTRQIIFQKGTDAQTHFIQIANKFMSTENMNMAMDKPSPFTDDQLIKVINYMRKQYRFTVNPNNASIFRPIVK